VPEAVGTPDALVALRAALGVSCIESIFSMLDHDVRQTRELHRSRGL
jgi:hypothetical protein